MTLQHLHLADSQLLNVAVRVNVGHCHLFQPPTIQIQVGPKAYFVKQQEASAYGLHQCLQHP